MKKKGILIVIIVFVLGVFGVRQFVKNESNLTKMLFDLNKQTPYQIDAATRLDSASTSGKKDFIFHYTLLDLEKSEINLDTVNKYVRPGIIKKVINDPKLKGFRENDLTIVYRYYDRNGAFVTEIAVTPAMYQKAGN